MTGLALESVTFPVDSAVVGVPVAPAPVEALAEGVPPTAESPLVMEASIVGEGPRDLFDLSVDETYVS